MTPILGTTVTAAATVIGQAFSDALDWDVDPTIIVGRPVPASDPCGDIIAVRLSALMFGRNRPCAGEVSARFEVSIVICIDDDPTVMDPDLVDVSGREIAETFWKAWAGVMHNLLTAGWDLAGQGVVDCGDVTFGDVSITYTVGQAMSRGEVTVSLPVVEETGS